MTNEHTIGSILRWYRNEQGKTISQVASDLETSPSAISLYENDKRKPNISTLERLVTILDIQPGDKELLFDLRNKDDEITEKIYEVKDNYKNQERVKEVIRRKRPIYLEKPDIELKMMDGLLTSLYIKNFKDHDSEVNLSTDRVRRYAQLIEKALVEFFSENKELIYKKMSDVLDEEIQRLHESLNLIPKSKEDSDDE